VLNCNYFNKEKVGRERLLSLISNENKNVTVNFTDNKYAVYDAYWNYTDQHGNDVNVIAEIKVRDAFYSDYIIEKSKLERLQSEALRLQNLDGKKRLVYYVNFCNDIAYFFNVTETKKWFRSGNLVMNRNTVKSKTEKVLKEIYYLTATKAIRYNVKNLTTTILNESIKYF
jgi:hypothetical protein